MLFVYGTLRKDVPNSRFHLMTREAREVRFVGRGRTQGRLFHLGEYPGLVASRDSDAWVHGELYALDQPFDPLADTLSDSLADTLARLDDYEGCGPNDPEPREYERVAMDVVLESGALDSGTNDKAWVYVYKGSTDNMRQIVSGDYSKEALE